MYRMKNYNFDIASSTSKLDDWLVSIEKDQLTTLIHDNELKRRIMLKELHDEYEAKYRELFYTSKAPKDSLNRFLLEQLSLRSNRIRKLHDSSCLLKPDNIMLNDTLAKEIRTDFVLIAKCKSTMNQMSYSKLKTRVEEYVRLAYRFLTSNKDEKTSGIRERVNQFQLFVKSHQKRKDELSERFATLHASCYAFFSNECENKIKQICEFLCDKLNVLAVNLNSIVLQIEAEALKSDIKLNVSSCSPCLRQLDSSRPESGMKIAYRNLSFAISDTHFRKLKLLYEKNAIERLKLVYNDDEFASRLFSLICRYESFFKHSIDFNEGYGMQASLPSKTFKHLHRLFGVEREMFASPFNCYFSTFFSAFMDTDIYFGSQGSFFEANLRGGSFQCNPPFTEELIERMAVHIDRLLDNDINAEPLSFIVFIPEWLEPPTPGLVRMDKSTHNRCSFVLPARQHRYVTGSQHLIRDFDSKYSLLYESSHNTKVFFLQNQLGYEKWTPTREKIEQLKIYLIDRNEWSFNSYNHGNKANSQMNFSFASKRFNSTLQSHESYDWKNHKRFKKF